MKKTTIRHIAGMNHTAHCQWVANHTDDDIRQHLETWHHFTDASRIPIDHLIRCHGHEHLSGAGLAQQKGEVGF